MNKLYEQYGSQVAFLIVYILEAHPTDVWQSESNIKEKIVFASPKDYQEREFVAGSCVRKLGIKFPAVLDGFDNSVEKAYTGWPDRIYCELSPPPRLLLRKRLPPLSVQRISTEPARPRDQHLTEIFKNGLPRAQRLRERQH